MTVYLGKAEWYCGKCASDSMEAHESCGEVDCPQHCAKCHEPLDYTLTSEGIKYVLDKMQEELDSYASAPKKAVKEWSKVHDAYKDTYYVGRPRIEIMRDWGKELENCAINDYEQHILDTFMLITLIAVK